VDNPIRVLQGQNTLLARTSHEIAVDTVHDEIVVTNPFAQAIMFFRDTAQGNEKPLRIIQGPKTLLGGDWDSDNVWYDEAYDEVYTAQSNSQSILVFSGRASGDVAPVRILHGSKTGMRAPRRVTVDAVNNLMAVLASEGVMFFDRTANGDVAPNCVIAGPKTGLGWVGAMNNSKVMLYAPAKKIIFGGGNRRVPKGYDDERIGNFFAIWKYGDCGDVPPLYKMKGGAGRFDLVPEAKQILTSGGDVLYMPEAF
jgi:hypothetical protein